MKRLLLALVLVFAFTGVVYPATVTKTFTWQAPTTNMDGSVLEDMDGYRLYCGSKSNSYGTIPIVDTKQTTAIHAFGDGTYYCNVTAYDTSGNESAFNGEVTFKVDTIAPASCSGLTVD